jgi:hypothetical protein
MNTGTARMQPLGGKLRKELFEGLGEELALKGLFQFAVVMTQDGVKPAQVLARGIIPEVVVQSFEFL